MTNLKDVRHIVGIAAGKGGVGKSTLALHLARYFALQGAKVGLMDADLYGPSIPKMLPAQRFPTQTFDKKRIVPAFAGGIKVISMGYFTEETMAVRAPIANGTIKQFIHDVEWGELDYLFIDFPPGTGDIQLTLMQESSLSGAILITTPQQIALLDVEKAFHMFENMQVPILGVVENMSYFLDHTGAVYPFAKDGGKIFAQEKNLLFLGAIPLDPQISLCCDRGECLFSVSNKNHATRAFEEIANQVREQLEANEKINKNYLIAVHPPNNHQFTIEWSDGRISTYRLSQVQRNCPCMRCRETVSSVEEDVDALRIEIIGDYALQITFTKGCSKGIYPFQLLRILECKEQYT